MNYLEIINLIFSILVGFTTLFYAHFVVFAIIGIFRKKHFPKAKEKLRYGVIIACRNEEKVIGNLIDSIHNTDYPSDKLQIFVIAHNCTDKTAEVCRLKGVNVFEYNNDKERTKGFALKYLFNQIKEQKLNANIDGYFIFDADNIVNKNYFDKMNDAFVACDKKSIVTSFRNSKNFGSSIISGMYGIYFFTSCRFAMCGRAVANCSGRITGTGFLFSAETIANGWEYVTLTEDLDFTADQIMNNHKITYCDDAEFFDEQPTSFKVMWRQRVRWAKGLLLVCITRLKSLIKSLFAKKDKIKYKFSIYDTIQNVMPFCLILAGLNVLQLIFTMLAPCFGISFDFAMIQWLKSFDLSALLSYVGLFIQGLFVLITEHKRIKNVSWWKKILFLFIWPIFILMQFIIDIVALFSRNITWKTIPHNDKTSFKDLGIKSKE